MLAWAARHRHTGTVSGLAHSTLLLLTIGGIAIAAVSSGFMVQRLRTKAPDVGRSRGQLDQWSGSARRQSRDGPFRHGARDLSAHRSCQQA
jgi:hypothetical protein